MIEAAFGLVLAAALTVGPLLWRVSVDRRRERALMLQAAIGAAVNQALGGESLLAVQVTPPGPWRRGRVILSAPLGWGWLVEAAWEAVMALLPAGYELVVRPGRVQVTTALSAAPFVRAS